MIPLIAFIALGLFILVMFEIRARRHPEVKQKDKEEAENSKKANITGECCGEHLVCERETLLHPNAEIVYYDDEELDSLAGIKAEKYTDAQYIQLRQVFDTMKESDVTGWVRSLQQRNIALPSDIREEALLIVKEQRHKA